ncbi:MAG: urate hydroxylase PuuD [Planctomycetes bacterium]|nr:urate hydroxylase PuuD [Planctomycetota bacterium]
MLLLQDPLVYPVPLEGGSSQAIEWVNFALRWFHVWFGVIWIGHLYFFNFVNANTMAKLDGPTKKIVVPQLMPRALFWFRWGAAVTWLTGILMFALVYFHQHLFFDKNGVAGVSGRAWWIMAGVLFGTVMAYNVWFIIWPLQKVIIAATRDGKAGEAEIQAKVRAAGLASRINTYLSVPLLSMMVSNHFTVLYSGNNWMWTIPLMIAIGFALVWHWYKVAPKVQGF